MKGKHYTTRKTSLEFTIQVTKLLGNLMSEKVLLIFIGIGFLGTILQLEFVAIASFLLTTVFLLLERIRVLKVEPVEERQKHHSSIDMNHSSKSYVIRAKSKREQAKTPFL